MPAIRDILIVTGGKNAGDFLRLLANGKHFGLKHIGYTYQEGEGGIADALALAEHFADGDKICVILGDNIIQGTIRERRGAVPAAAARRAHLAEEGSGRRAIRGGGDRGNRIVNIEEKPKRPKSDFAVTGIYMYDATVFDKIKTLVPSRRGELEITDVNNAYIAEGKMTFSFLDGWWTDAGTFESLLRAGNLVAQSRRAKPGSCPAVGKSRSIDRECRGSNRRLAKSMRIALDATPLTLTTGGLARYTAELSTALAENYPEDDFTLLSDRPFDMPASRHSNLSRGAPPRNALERRWWIWGVQREMNRLQCALFHGTNFEVPYAPLRPSVVTVHDLSPWMNPAWHHAADRVRRRTPLIVGLRIATMTITPTRAVRAQIIERFHAAPSRVVAVPHGASGTFRPAPAEHRAPYFLYAGTLEPRKNLELLIEAWRAARRTSAVDLILAGRARADFTRPAPEPGLQLPGEVSDADLARLYSGAVAVVYPSYYEGFGLPVLEAMQCGACVFISQDPALQEVGGDAALVLDRPRSWVEAMRAASGSPEWLAQRRDASLARAREFSWARTARLTREVYEEAMRRFAF